MRLVRSLQICSNPLPPVALAIGNFDGLHLGHQALIRAALARAPDLEPALMCFEPLPATLFRPEHPVPRLMSVHARLALCRQLGLQRVFMPRFDRRFAALSPEDFARQVVVGVAGARHLVVGQDFRFGARAAGDVEQLRVLGHALGFTVEVIAPVCQGGRKVSSTRIRGLLAEGDFEAAARLLGRHYAIAGRVLHGQELGRRLGFPTINIRPPLPPALSGVFAVRVDGADLAAHPGVANLGCRPTVDGRRWLLEVHLFDYAGDLYGRRLAVEFVEYLRPEEKFDGLDSMKRQMTQDAERARAILGAS